MEQASRTAFGAALLRAAHQLLDIPPVFADPLALTIVGEAAGALRERIADPDTARMTPLRLFIAVRSRFTEDCLAEAMVRGVRQYVLLGAGLDTFAFRVADPSLTIFEVDHPATQAWKKRLLRETKIEARAKPIFAPVDFECETLRNGLARAGFDFAKPAFFAWLGVTPYLSHEAIEATLAFVGLLPKGSEIVFDYSEPRDNRDSDRQKFFDALTERVAAQGEPFRSFFTPDELTAFLKRTGFAEAEDWDAAKLNARYFENRADGKKLRGGHLMRARV